MTELELVNPRPELFVDRNTGGIVLLHGRRHGYLPSAEQTLGSYIVASILVWNRAKQQTETLVVFGCN